MGDDDGISTSNGRLISKDVKHLEMALADTRADIKSDIKALDDRISKHIEMCDKCRINTAVELATLKEQVKQGDEKATTVASIISSLAGAFTGIVAALWGGKP